MRCTDSEAASVALGVRSSTSLQALVHGFRSRVVRHGEASIEHNFFKSVWSDYEACTHEHACNFLLLESRPLTVSSFETSVNYSTKTDVLNVKYDGFLFKMKPSSWVAAATLACTQNASLACESLFLLEQALALLQLQIAVSAMLPMMLLTSGLARDSTAQAGAWGLTRSVRAETASAVKCIGGSPRVLFKLGPFLSEPELVVTHNRCRVPRLVAESTSINSLMRLHFHARGTINNLFLEPQPHLHASREAEAILRVRAVGLNFRDVLNVLGEYPGDPGPPGADAAGVVESLKLHSSESAGSTQVDDAVFGLAHAPLAKFAVTSLSLLARKASALRFEQASTLPVSSSLLGRPQNMDLVLLVIGRDWRPPR